MGTRGIDFRQGVVMTIRDAARRFATRFLPHETEEGPAARQMAAMVIEVGGVLATAFYLAVFLFFGYMRPALVNALYSILVVANIVVFLFTKNLRFNVHVACGLLMLYIVLIQWSLGGIHRSGLVIIWGALGPVVSALLLGRRAALAWLGVFVLTIVIAIAGDPFTLPHAPPVSPIYSVANTAINLALLAALMVVAILFLLARLDTALERADQLLLNVLPEPIAARLKASPGTIAEEHPEATVLFADIVGFTRMSGACEPADVVNMLNAIFTDFDLLAERLGLEKIKTIGDAYMVAGGVPLFRPDHASAMAEMALGMIDIAQRHQTCDGGPVNLRIGLNTGPVIAGVIGRRKFIYDLWGDAVNIASRMESTGRPNSIQVAEATYQRLHHAYDFIRNEPIAVKGKGIMRTYSLLRRKPPEPGPGRADTPWPGTP